MYCFCGGDWPLKNDFRKSAKVKRLQLEEIAKLCEMRTFLTDNGYHAIYNLNNLRYNYETYCSDSVFLQFL